MKLNVLEVGRLILLLTVDHHKLMERNSNQFLTAG